MWQIRNYKWHTTEICELDVLSQAWRTARRRALDRLREEAMHVNADVVVGVRLHRSDHDLGQGTIEYVVTGTAVRLPGSTASNMPVLTDLSVQDYWRLNQAGQEPVGFLATTAVMFASPPSTSVCGAAGHAGATRSSRSSARRSASRVRPSGRRSRARSRMLAARARWV